MRGLDLETRGGTHCAEHIDPLRANALHHGQIKTQCRLNSTGVHRPHAEGGPCVAMMGCAEDTEANRQNLVILCKAAEHTAHTHTALTSARHGRAGQGCAVWNHIHLGCVSLCGVVAEWRVVGSSLFFCSSHQHRTRYRTGASSQEESAQYRHAGWYRDTRRKGWNAIQNQAPGMAI